MALTSTRTEVLPDVPGTGLTVQRRTNTAAASGAGAPSTARKSSPLSPGNPPEWARSCSTFCCASRAAVVPSRAARIDPLAVRSRPAAPVNNTAIDARATSTSAIVNPDDGDERSTRRTCATSSPSRSRAKRLIAGAWLQKLQRGTKGTWRNLQPSDPEATEVPLDESLPPER
jgi:hypothetical protein